MNRRKTYGGNMFNNNNNRSNNMHRHSMAQPLQNNMSMGNRGMGMGNNRRSSMMMQGMKMTKDPRPLKDKQWVQEQIQLLIQYLCGHGYESSMLSPKELNPPSTKNFQFICCFLFQQIDPTFMLNGNGANQSQNSKGRGAASFEEECIAFFEKLGYPFKITKSSMRCIAPHSWPALLGAVSWIIELLMFAESFDEDDDDTENDNNAENEDDIDGDGNAKSQRADRAFFALVAENYAVWLQGKVDDETLKQRLMASSLQRIEFLHSQISTFEKANSQLSTEEQRISDDMPSITELQDERQGMLSAMAEMKSVSAARVEYIAKLKAEHHEWDCKVAEKALKIDEAEHKIENLKKALSTQTLSAADVEQMSRESIALNTETDELQLQKANLKRKQFDLSVEIGNVLKRMKHSVAEYNELARRIELIPATAKYSFAQDHTLRLRAELEQNGHGHEMGDEQRALSVTNPSDLCNQDLSDDLSLSQLAAHFADKVAKLGVAVKGEKERIGTLVSDLDIAQKEVAILNERQRNIVALFNEEKGKMSLLTASTAANIERIELSINTQSNDTDGELKNKRKEEAHAHEQLNELKEHYEKIRIQITAKVGSLTQKLCQERKMVRDRLKHAHKVLDESMHKASFYHIQEPTMVNINYQPTQNMHSHGGDVDMQHASR